MGVDWLAQTGYLVTLECRNELTSQARSQRTEVTSGSEELLSTWRPGRDRLTLCTLLHLVDVRGHHVLADVALGALAAVCSRPG